MLANADTNFFTCLGPFFFCVGFVVWSFFVAFSWWDFLDGGW